MARSQGFLCDNPIAAELPTILCISNGQCPRLQDFLGDNPIADRLPNFLSKNKQRDHARGRTRLSAINQLPSCPTSSAQVEDKNRGHTTSSATTPLPPRSHDILSN